MRSPRGRAGRRPPRILHAPWNIGGNPAGLSSAERELGMTSDVMVLGDNPFGYRADINLDIAGEVGPDADRKRARFVLRAIRRYDVFHFNFGQTIYSRFDKRGRLRTELAWLKRLGKVVLATYQGDDARPPEANPFAGYTEAGLAEQALLQPKRRDAMLRHADRVFYLNPDLREWLPGAEFRPYASFDPRSVSPRPAPGGDEVVIAHAPSARSQKGTDRVLDAVNALQRAGEKVRVDLIENVPREEAIERTARADVVIDQINIGWYGGYAVEAMSLGRPVVCHIREGAPGDNPMGDDLPIVRTTSEALEDDLRALIRDRPRMAELGRRSRSFVERWHDPRRIALRNLEGLVPTPTHDPGLGS